MSQIGSGAGTGYPNQIDTAKTEVALPSALKTLVMAEGANDERAAIVALETAVGTNPQGSQADFKTRVMKEHDAFGVHDFSGFTDIGAHLAGTQAISSNTLTTVLFDTKDYDDLGEFDLVTNKGRFTATKTGEYLFTIGLYGQVGMQVHIYVNGADQIDLNPITNNEPSSRSFHVKMTAGDYAEIRIINASVGFNLIPYGFQSLNSNWIRISRLK